MQVQYPKLRSVIFEVLEEGHIGFTETEIGKVFVDRWRQSDCKRDHAYPESSFYRNRRSHVMGSIQIVLRRDYSERDDRESLNDRKTAAVILHEFSHHLVSEERAGTGHCTTFENEMLAWAKAKQLWRRCGLKDFFGSMPTELAAFCLSNYWEGSTWQQDENILERDWTRHEWLLQAPSDVAQQHAKYISYLRAQ